MDIRSLITSPIFVTTGVRVYELIDSSVDSANRVLLYCEDIVSGARGWRHTTTLRVVGHETILLDLQGYVITDTGTFNDCDSAESYRRYCEMEGTF